MGGAPGVIGSTRVNRTIHDVAQDQNIVCEHLKKDRFQFCWSTTFSTPGAGVMM